MDVTMGKKTVVCYHKVFEYANLSESAVESVVPDTMPDIERILCADGTLVIRSKEVSEGSVSVTAGIAASVLYVPDGKAGVCCLKAAIPFSYSTDAPGVTTDSIPVAMFTLMSVEAHMLNPRKVVVRATVEVKITCYDRAEADYCCEVSGGNEEDIQLLVDKLAISHDVCVKEKTFVGTDELRLPAGKPGVGELLRDTVELSAEDIRTVGSKVVINGTAKIGLTYTVAGGSDIAFAEFETAFSQLIEADSELGAPEFKVWLLLTAVFIEPHTYVGGEQGFTCELHIVAQTVCSDSVGVEYISDCYSNRRRIEAESRASRVMCDVGRMQQRCNFHDQLETAQDVCEVKAVSCSAADFKIENGSIKSKLAVTVLYSDEAGELFCVTRRFPMECPSGIEAGMCGAVLSASCAQVYAVPAQNAIDLRAQVTFDLMCWREVEITQITGVDFIEEEEVKTERPSLVVVRAGEDASLWLLAKRYRSTREMIRTANSLEEGEPIIGKILLIPTAK